MNRNTEFQDLGFIEYEKAWNYQEKLFSEIIELKKNKAISKNYLLFCEHPHVYTLGKSGSENNLLISFLELQNAKASFFKTNRGGDITYHGPGQIVGYPILDLDNFRLGLKDYIFNIEDAIIELLKKYNITAERLPDATGVWLDTDTPHKTRKICAIGVRSSRFVTMHGFAFNVNTNLEYFNYINPCGFTDKQVTSLEKETGRQLDMQTVKSQLKQKIAEVFGMELCS